MESRLNRRNMLHTTLATGAAGLLWQPARVRAAKRSPDWTNSVKNGLNWIAQNQTSLGHWAQTGYPTAMTALAGTALICSGSTTTQGPYAKQIRRTVSYLMNKRTTQGLIGDPNSDNRYTYGHGFSMLFLSQVLGEEEDVERREELIEVLKAAVTFSGKAQTASGGWGYVSSANSTFDEGSTTITQVQGLRGCRNAGIPVPGDVIDRAKEYIYKCKNPDGGISYSSRNRGTSRPAITAAALAALYNAGDYESKHGPEMLEYCKKNLHNVGTNSRTVGHWHYTYLYYSQVVYRQGKDLWNPFRDKLCKTIISEQRNDGSWNLDSFGPVYSTACNLIMLQMDLAYLPIYQR
ncbi:MAG: prenyltransferase/squalene oxidase repeat-containing protein [Pirellulaceae bacterium]